MTGSTYYKAALPGGWIAPAGSAHTNGYCGYVFNQESGFYTVRFRHYDPVWGRWIERDPAGYMDSMSLYGYGWGSPLSIVDPFGTDVWIEGPSGPEPNGHQAICVGDPNGKYTCFSFGVNGEFDWGLVGEVYEDTDRGGEIVKEMYLRTSKYGDEFALAYLKLLLGRKGAYRLCNANCRTWSQREFEILKEYLMERHHAVPVTPRPRTVKPNSGGSGPSSPSTGSSSGSTTTTSDPTAAGSNSTTNSTCTSS